MLSSYFVTALRASNRNKLLTAVNLLGLAVGIAAALLIILYVRFELSFDNFQPNLESTYRLSQQQNEQGAGINEHQMASNSASLAVHRIAKDLPEIQGLFALFGLNSRVDDNVEVDGQSFRLNKHFAASPNITEFIELDVIHGNINKALSEPDQIALSVRQALRLFGKIDVVGKRLARKQGNWTVAAVFDELPTNTHFDFNSLSYVEAFDNPDAFSKNFAATYVRLPSDVDISALTEKLTRLVNEKSIEPWAVGLMPLADVHLKSNSTQSTVTISMVLALLLIGVACFNYVNMAIAQAGQRAKEIGVRKALGVGKLELMAQFIFESVIMVFISMVLAVFITKLSLDWFNKLIELNLVMLFDLQLLALLLGLTLSIGVLAGLYPALYISSFNAKRVLSGDFQRGGTAIMIRKVLLLVQFVFSIGLLIVTGTLYRQINLLSDLPVGYAKTARMEIRGIDAQRVFFNHNSALIKEIERIDGVYRASPFDRTLTESDGVGLDIYYPNAPEQKHNIGFSGTGFGFAETAGLEILAGRDFDQKFASDWYHKNSDGGERASIIITRSTAKSAGFDSPEQAIGKTFRLGMHESNDFVVTVVGVVKDIEIGPVYDFAYQLFFMNGYTWYDKVNLLLYIDESKMAQVQMAVARVLKRQLGLKSIDTRLVETGYEAIYQSEKRQLRLVLAFSILAVFLNGVGIFGMAAFGAQRLSRQLAIRKVLGASNLNLLNLLATEYLLTLAVSVLLALPLAYYFTNDWLMYFSERVSQSLLLYVGAVALVGSITWITISLIGYRVARISPAITLHDE